MGTPTPRAFKMTTRKQGITALTYLAKGVDEKEAPTQIAKIWDRLSEDEKTIVVILYHALTEK